MSLAPSAAASAAAPCCSARLRRHSCTCSLMRPYRLTACSCCPSRSGCMYSGNRWATAACGREEGSRNQALVNNNKQALSHHCAHCRPAMQAKACSTRTSAAKAPTPIPAGPACCWMRGKRRAQRRPGTGGRRAGRRPPPHPAAAGAPGSAAPARERGVEALAPQLGGRSQCMSLTALPTVKQHMHCASHCQTPLTLQVCHCHRTRCSWSGR